MESAKRIILVTFVIVGAFMDGLAWSGSDPVMASFAFIHVMLTGLVFMFIWDMAINDRNRQ